MRSTAITCLLVLVALLHAAPAILTLRAQSVAAGSNDSSRQDSSRQSPVTKLRPYQILKTIALPGTESWNHVVADPEARRVYVTRRTHVTVLNSDSGEVVGDIPDTPGVHAVALASELGRGFATNGSANSVTIFDSKSLRTIATVHIPGTNPNSVVYDPRSQFVFVMNSRSQSITVMKARDGKVVGTIALVDNPESAVADGKGHLYVVLADPAEIAVIDTLKISLLERIQLAPCIEPRGVAIDLNASRLFAACSNSLLVVVDPSSRQIVARVPIGVRAGDVVLDPGAHVVFTANAEGTVSVVREAFPDKYTVVDTVATMRGASTIAIDVSSHKLFVPTVRLGSRGNERPSIIPRSFVVLVLGSAPGNHFDRTATSIAILFNCRPQCPKVRVNRSCIPGTRKLRPNDQARIPSDPLTETVGPGVKGPMIFPPST